MGLFASRHDPLRYDRSARKDVRPWAMLLIGVAFIVTGSVVDPLRNCDSAGNCAPWLVPVAYCMGIVFAVIGAGQLYANPRRGSRVDLATGEVIWWQNCVRGSDGDGGRIHASRIARVRLDLGGDNDSVSLYDVDGERLPFFDVEVIPWPYASWAERLQRAWPHIRIEEIK